MTSDTDRSSDAPEARLSRPVDFTDRNGLEVLARDECLRLLATASLGRIAISVHALPVIVPVNFLLDGDQIVIRTGPGTKLDAAARSAVVAFEVDEFEASNHAGWSVSATGFAREVVDQRELERIGRLPLPHWSPDGAGHVMALSLDVVTGRRIPQAGSPNV